MRNAVVYIHLPIEIRNDDFFWKLKQLDLLHCNDMNRSELSTVVEQFMLSQLHLTKFNENLVALLSHSLSHTQCIASFLCSNIHFAYFQSLAVNNIYVGTGSDFTGVITKMLSMNGSLRISVYNPATFFGIHVSSTPINLVYSEITVATGQVILLPLVHDFPIF